MGDKEPNSCALDAVALVDSVSMTRNSRKWLLSLLLSGVLVWGTFAPLLMRQQSEVHFVEPISTPSRSTSVETNIDSLVPSKIGLDHATRKGLEEKYGLLFTFSQLILYGTNSP